MNRQDIQAALIAQFQRLNSIPQEAIMGSPTSLFMYEFALATNLAAQATLETVNPLRNLVM